MEDEIKWHPAFYGGIELELREYRNALEFEEEHELSKEPLHMDMLVIKKLSDVVISNTIGRVFRKFNVIEYKSPQDTLSMREFYKTIGYAFLYKGLSETVEAVPITELTVSLFRHKKPIKLIKNLIEVGAEIENTYEGVYYVLKVVNIPVQIVVTSELKSGEHNPLRILTMDADEQDLRRFISEAKELQNPGDQDNAEAVLKASIAANSKLYEKVRREGNMYDSLRELMKEDLEQAKEEGEDRLGKLISLMIAANDNEAIEKVSTDKNVREEYYAKYNV